MTKVINRSGLWLTVILLFLVMAPPLPVSADIILPEEFYGDIIVNGRTAPVGTVITAKIGSAERGSITTTEVGQYGGPGTFDGSLVVAGEEDEVGEAITFWVSGSRAEQTAVYEPGQSTDLDLTVEVFPLDASDAQITEALDYLAGEQQSDGKIAAFATSGWAVMAIAAAGEDPDSWTNGGDSIVDYMRSNMDHLDANKATDWERFILAVVAAGENPRDFGGVDCIATLLDFYDGTQIGDDGMLNDDFWGILALASIGETQGVADSKNFIINNQNSDGGWGWIVGDVSDADNTAAAISALLAAGQSSSSQVITDALAYLKSQQQNDGGFSSEGSTNAGVDTWAINAIVDVGQSPVADAWRKSGNNPIGHLLSLQDTDGAFKWSATQRSSPEWMTAYAVIALLGGSWPEDATAPAISSLSPSSGASTTSTSPTIGASYSDATSGIDTGTATMTLDGTDITSSSTVTSSGISYSSSGLSTGTHSVTVTVSDKKGNEASRNWSFSVTTSSGGGGGGGGGGSAAGITPVSAYLTSSGKFTEDVTAESEDGKVELYIPEDTIGKNKFGALLSSISIVEQENPPDPPQKSNVVGLVYDFGPDGATFDPPVSLTVEYTKSKIPDGVAEENLVVAYWDEDADEWVELEGTVDPENNTVTVEISHFTDFTVLAYTRPASFDITDLSINPTEASVEETVTISVIVTNAGDLTDTYEVILKMNGSEVEVEEAEVIGGESETVSFRVTLSAAGTYTVEIASLSGSFVVKEEVASLALPTPSLPAPTSALPTPSPSPEAPETEAPTPMPSAPLPPPPPDKPTNWLLIGGIVAGVAVFGLLIFFLVRRYFYY